MTIYDDMRGYVHTHDRNGWFDVIAKTTPMYQMIDKADAENAKLRKLMNTMRKTLDSAESDVCSHCDLFGNCADNDWHECEFDKRMRELGVEVDA